ncbi:hypothetical protein OG444_01135 [Streptomyces sp. NBC_01232]|uniref:hypothetical protein n=1 Tax=Streptomyces sp. NBC_01232 TaxID=2903786 RepID=UPI002E14B2AC|nr:hypothetical protein OG444_01135 [Streptomyces sp. NBC_01232]
MDAQIGEKVELGLVEPVVPGLGGADPDSELHGVLVAVDVHGLDVSPGEVQRAPSTETL